MRLFTSPRVTAFLQRFRPPEGEAISAKVLNKSIETAQKRVEQRNYTMRKHTLEYDDVMNKQRTEIYSFRNEVLSTLDTLSLAKDILESVCVQMSSKLLMSVSKDGHTNPDNFRQWLMTHFPVTLEKELFDGDYRRAEELEQIAIDKVLHAFDTKIAHEEAVIAKIQEMIPEGAPKAPPISILKEVVRSLLIRNIDKHWQEHLLNIDHLRTEVHLRVVGQKDPLLEFKHEAFALFDAFSLKIKTEIAHALFKFEMIAPQRQAAPREVPRQAPQRLGGPISLENLNLEEEVVTLEKDS
jgi:preprotein translocase subunit SecA